VLVEIQALVVRLASGATPRRSAVGWDSGRLAMILAVLEARCGLSFATAEVYLNVAGGYRLTDPAADLAVAAALISALSERPVPNECITFGEIALSGEVRQVAHSGLRLKEAAKLGSRRPGCPPERRRREESRPRHSPTSDRWSIKFWGAEKQRSGSTAMGDGPSRFHWASKRSGPCGSRGARTAPNPGDTTTNWCAPLHEAQEASAFQ